MHHMEDNKILFYNNREKDLNLVDLYLEQISKYELLTLDEEQELGKKLKFINIIDPFFIRKNKKEYKYSLNYINILFSLNLYKCMDYEKIIDLIIDYLSKQDNEKDKKSLKLIKKYKEISRKLNRALNDKELKEYFNITYDKNRWGYSSTEIEHYIELFIEYSKAFDLMYKSNLKLVVSIAQKYKTKISFLDLINEGNIGLMSAIKKFDYEKGNKFSTYAVHWIKQAINNCVFENKYNIRIPYSLYAKIISFYKKRKQLENKYNRKFSILELSQELNITLEEIMNYIKYSQETVSINTKIGENDDTELIDFIEDNYEIENNFINNQLVEDMNILFSILSEKELKIIKLRNGLIDGKIYTLQEIADEYGVSRERIRQIENRAMEKMLRLSKTNPKCKELKYYLK